MRQNGALTWFCNETAIMISHTGSGKLQTKFESLRREINANIKQQHDLYVNKLVGDVKANPRDFYRYIKKDRQYIPPLKRWEEMELLD